MKRFLITVSALSLLAAPAVSIAQTANPDREARRAERQAARQAGEGPSQEERQARRAARQADDQADDQADALVEQRAQRQAEREAAQQQRQAEAAAAAQAGQVDSELLARDHAARAEAEANFRRVEDGRPRVGEDRVRPEDRRYERQEDRRDRREARQPNTPPGMVVPPTFNEGRDGRWERRDDRRDRREDRRDYRQDRWEDRRDYRQDRWEDRREFRQERRQRTFQYRGRDYSAYRAPAYRWSSGIRSRNWIVGAFLPAPLITQNYVLRDYWNYDLPRPPLGTYYVRVDTDVYLVAVRGGRVIDVIRDVFYYDDGYGYGW